MVSLGGYINTKDAALLMDVTSDYVCRLCRNGVLDALKVGHDWMVREESARRYTPGPQGFALHPRTKRQLQ